MERPDDIMEIVEHLIALHLMWWEPWSFDPLFTSGGGIISEEDGMIRELHNVTLDCTHTEHRAMLSQFGRRFIDACVPDELPATTPLIETEYFLGNPTRSNHRPVDHAQSIPTIRRMSAFRQKTTLALTHLRSADPVMCRVIDEVGPFSLRLQRDRFKMLVRSIISQQISTGAARSIRKRLEELAVPDGLTAVSLGRFSPEQLRTAGVSPQKAKYILDLSANVNEERINLQQMGRYSDERVIEQLTIVKGIGRWTAQMFLIFALGRLDVFPHDDLGVRSAIRNRYDLDELPDKETSCAIAETWRPYASVASWYCWRSLDVERPKNGAGNAKRG